MRNDDDIIVKDDFFGRMSHPSAGSWVAEPCGDTMEFYLVISDGVIEKVEYYTDGCEFTRRCGMAVAQYVQGKNTSDAIAISAKQVLEELGQIPQEKRHSAILAVSAFYTALDQFCVQQANS